MSTKATSLNQDRSLIHQDTRPRVGDAPVFELLLSLLIIIVIIVLLLSQEASGVGLAP
jgi:hypothetical protein